MRDSEIQCDQYFAELILEAGTAACLETDASLLPEKITIPSFSELLTRYTFALATPNGACAYIDVVKHESLLRYSARVKFGWVSGEISAVYEEWINTDGYYSKLVTPTRQATLPGLEYFFHSSVDSTYHYYIRPRTHAFFLQSVAMFAKRHFG